MAILRFTGVYILLFLQAQTSGLSPIEYLQKLIATTEKFVDDTLVYVKNASRYLNKNLEPAVKQFVNFTSSAIDSIWDNIESELNSIKQVTNPNLQLVIDCIIGNRDSLKVVPLGLFSEVALCTSGSSLPITNVTQFICSKLQRIQREVRLATGQLKRCTGSIEKTFNCTVDVAHNVSKVLQKIPTEVGDDWSVLVYSIQSMEETYEYCLEFNAAEAREKYIRVFENISDCIVTNAANGSDPDPDQNRAAFLGNDVPPLILLANISIAILNRLM